MLDSQHRRTGGCALLVLSALACVRTVRRLHELDGTQGLSLASAVALSDGRDMPLLGLGVYSLSPQEAYGAVLDALRAGVRHIDTAELYENEVAVGKALRDSGIPRDEIWLTTKAWVGRTAAQRPGYDGVLAALKASLWRLNTTYVDLYLLHSPIGDARERGARWRAMMDAKAASWARSIGVSNYGVRHLQELEGSSETPVTNQIELSPWLQRRAIEAYCDAHGIVMTAWGALAPRCRHGQAACETGVSMSSGVLQAMAARLGVSTFQVLLRWTLQAGHVALFTTTSETHLRNDIDLFAFELAPADLAEMATWDADIHTGWDPANWADTFVH